MMSTEGDKCMDNNKMVLGKEIEYSLDCYATKRNNNVIVVGASGAGKTRGIVSPNLLMASGSYIISDPKGNLYNKYRGYLEERGYIVKKLDFTNPRDSAHYNFLNYIREPKDILKVANMLMYQDGTDSKKKVNDPFWEQAAEMMLSAIISYVIEFESPERMNFSTIIELLKKCRNTEDSMYETTAMDSKIADAEREYPHSWAVQQYKSVRVAAPRTLNSIIISAMVKLRNFDSFETRQMMAYDDIDIASIGQKKTALFVIVSDTDRSMDNIANLFYTQAMNELCLYADNYCRDCALPIPVRFILDDFATNCRIGDFPRMISSIRSRGISVMLMVQAESQLSHSYGEEGRTIIGNCDTYVYLGGSDNATAESVAIKCDVQIKRILNLPIGDLIVMRRGDIPRYGTVIDLDEFESAMDYHKVPIAADRRVQKKPLKEILHGGRAVLTYQRRRELYGERKSE